MIDEGVLPVAGAATATGTYTKVTTGVGESDLVMVRVEVSEGVCVTVGVTDGVGVAVGVDVVIDDAEPEKEVTADEELLIDDESEKVIELSVVIVAEIVTLPVADPLLV